jgi:hypothetical protein
MASLRVFRDDDGIEGGLTFKQEAEKWVLSERFSSASCGNGWEIGKPGGLVEKV